MITQYLGNDNYTLHLTSGKEIELTEDEITEIVNENITTKNRIINLENDVSKYRALYDKADCRVNDITKHIDLIESIIMDDGIDSTNTLLKISEQINLIKGE